MSKPGVPAPRPLRRCGGQIASFIVKCIAKQLKEDELSEQLEMSEFGQFTCGKQQPERDWQTVLCVLRICEEHMVLPA